MLSYLVTTNKDKIPACPVVMIDGTVPGWTPNRREGDHHYDHHKPGGGRVQIDEMPALDGSPRVQPYDNRVIITTQVDADACVAAAWLQLDNSISEDAKRKLRAIALDCDYLCIPPGEEDYSDLAVFAAKAVAALKESSKPYVEELGLSFDRKTWDEDDKIKFASYCFQRGTEWLIGAAKGGRNFPGENGEADNYFLEMSRDIDSLRQLKAVRLIEGCAVLDQRSIGKYVDPRCLVALAKEMGADQPITLTVRSMPLSIPPISIPAYSYTLGSLPYHEQAQTLDLTKVFPVLAKEEAQRRSDLVFPIAETTWGGRAAVGGSGWRDPSLLSPEEAIKIALSEIY